jgi:hypothetical protein
MARVTRADRGSVLPLLVGLVALLMIAMSALVSLGQVVHERRGLYQIADEVVIAASRSIDLEAYYSGGAASSVPLSKDDVVAFVSRSAAGVRVDLVDVADGEVRLVLSRQVDLLWGWSRRIEVEVAAKGLVDAH